jgi:oligopeptidase B
MPSAPAAARVDTVRSHHGDDVVDPYEWLRDPSDPAVVAHLEAENAYAAAQTGHLEGLRTTIYDEIVARTQQTDLSVPSRRGAWWYYSRTSEGSQYTVSCRCPATGPHDDPSGWTPPTIEPGVPAPGEEVLVDGNAEAEGHAFFSLGALSVSPDDHLLAYSVDVQGDERFTLRVKDLRSGELLPDEVPGIFYGASWGGDSASVYYTVVDDAWRPYEVRRHVLGTPTDSDTVVHTEPDERFWVGVETTTSDRFLLVGAASRTTSEVRALDLRDPSAEPVLVAARRDGVEYDVDHAVVAGRDRFVITHNDGAKDFAVALADVGDPDPSHWTELVPHVEGRRVLGAVGLDRAIALQLRRDALTRVVVLPLDDSADGGVGEPWEVEFDEPLFSSDIGQVSDPATPLLRVGYTSFVTPATVYDVDLASRELLLRKRTPVLGGFDSADYEQHREWATAEDGTQVPVSVVCRRGTPRDGTAPVLLYGYGSYEHSIDPSFAVPRLSLLDRGVVFAVAHVRGGGEMGRAWYEQGRMEHKVNTFTDFVAAGRHLVEAGWAHPDRVVAMGGSAGGLLVGAALNLAPDLFAGVVAQVPFVDALTTILDPSLPLTVIEWEEWGDPLHDADVYAYMKGYTPYENVRDVAYPPVLALTSLHDARVLFVEPAKWVARLRETAPQGGPYLLKTVMDGGHGGVSGRYETWKERAYEMAWALERLGVAGGR